jgi:hypothetical protein
MRLQPCVTNKHGMCRYHDPTWIYGHHRKKLVYTETVDTRTRKLLCDASTNLTPGRGLNRAVLWGLPCPLGGLEGH